MGQQPLTPDALATPYTGNNPSAFKFAQGWHEKADEAWAYIDKARKKMKKWADTKRRHLKLQVGDLVMLKLLPNQFKALRSLHKNLIRKYEGPFPITKRNDSTAYQLELPPRLYM